MSRKLIAGALIAGLFVCATGCSKGRGDNAGRYLTADVETGDVERTVLSSGTLQPFVVVNVGAQATGQIQSLKVKLGDVVKRGQQLGVIDPAIQRNTLRNAEAALAVQQGQNAQQQAQLEKTLIDLNRQKALLDQGYASPAAYDQAAAQVALARAAVRTTTAQVTQARILVEKAQVDLGRTNVIAPIDGVVASILVREGQSVNAVQMSPTLLRLAKMDVMTVKAQISEADVVRVRPGSVAYFTILGDPSRRYYGRLRTVEPAPDNADDTLTAPATAAVYYNALFDVPNADGRLRSSMTAQVSVVLAQAKGVLTAPSGALGKRSADGRYLVKVLGADGKTTTDRQVRVGVSDSGRAEILDGLKRGEKVVVGDALNAPAPRGRKPSEK